MIRHASTSPAKPVLSLPHAVSPSPKFSPLMAAIGRTALSPSSYLPARLAAVALAPVAMAADAEDGPTGTTVAHSEDNLGHDHPSSPINLHETTR